MISKEKQEALKERMELLDIKEDDLVEKFVLGSGKGGQKVNKTFSTVYLKHLPTGIEIKCQQERSRSLNRFFARRLLCEKIEERLNVEKTAKQKAIDKLRKQKKRRSRRIQQKLLEEKRSHAQVKKMRKSPSSDEY
ncbi:MAG: peptide chain release factor-like protein [Simkaniaceae bacterium]|nr:peptide chain release factor-like protein [Simkaniaceae bacterium]MCF7853025.1 peptide chain release factor-like protein [Simkaniaceae bacterium]